MIVRSNILAFLESTNPLFTLLYMVGISCFRVQWKILLITLKVFISYPSSFNDTHLGKDCLRDIKNTYVSF